MQSQPDQVCLLKFHGIDLHRQSTTHEVKMKTVRPSAEPLTNFGQSRPRVTPAARWSPSIAMRLVAVVLATGILAFGALGSLTSLRFNVALQEQAKALGQLSERQLAVRLDG